MIRGFLAALLMALVSAIAVQAQRDDYRKSEFFVGYSNGQVDTGLDSGSSVRAFFRDRANFNGFNVSGVYNVSRYVGIKGDVSGTYNKSRFAETFVDPTTGTTFAAAFHTRSSLYNIVGGVQVKDNSRDGWFKPFGHAMIGLGHSRTKVRDVACAPVAFCPVVEESFSDNGFAGVFGGGIDLKVHRKIQIRAIQVDYNPVWVNSQVDHNLRLGTGVVF